MFFVLILFDSCWVAGFRYCQAQPQLKPNWAELVIFPIPPTADRPAGRPTIRNSTFYPQLTNIFKDKVLSLYEVTSCQLFNHI